MKITRTPPRVEELENRLVPSYSFNGMFNNLSHTDWGSTGVNLLRQAAAAYADNVSAVGGLNRPSPRVISNTVAAQSDDIISDRFLSAMIYAWGQFLDHDLDLTPTGGTDVMHIAVPTGDPFFDPNGTGTQTIDTTRSVFNTNTGTSTSNPRQQINTVTAWLDGSMIYGSDATTAAALRSFFRGRLKTSPGGMLPFNNATYFPNGTLTMANDSHIVPDDQMFAAGDVRANENIELTSLHTLFVREHNFWANLFFSQNHNLSDDQLYQKARDRVIGEIQAITFNQWLPSLLGSGVVPSYNGYKPWVNPGVNNEFSAAGFRLGHSLLGDDVEFLDNNGRPVADEVALSEAFFNPPLLSANGISPVLKYLASDPSSELDNMVVNSVRNFLFGPPGSGGLDLASLNIQRGRDHGLADYNTVRAAYGLPKVTSFAQITSDTTLQTRLQQLYGNVDNIDLWVGALAENHLPGSTVGKTVRAIVLDQFTRLRDGDRFWYQRSFSNSTVSDINNTTLSDIIKRNTSLTNLQSNPFIFRASISGKVFFDQNHNGRFDFHDFGLGGRTVELVNADDEVIATTQTDSQGRYSFNVADGLTVGDYVVRVANKPVSKQVNIPKGEVFLTGIDLGLFSPF